MPAKHDAFLAVRLELVLQLAEPSQRYTQFEARQDWVLSINTGKGEDSVKQE